MAERQAPRPVVDDASRLLCAHCQLGGGRRCRRRCAAGVETCMAGQALDRFEAAGPYGTGSRLRQGARDAFWREAYTMARSPRRALAEAAEAHARAPRGLPFEDVPGFM